MELYYIVYAMKNHRNDTIPTRYITEEGRMTMKYCRKHQFNLKTEDRLGSHGSFYMIYYNFRSHRP